jgi:hypothetical protein
MWPRRGATDDSHRPAGLAVIHCRITDHAGTGRTDSGCAGRARCVPREAFGRTALGNTADAHRGNSLDRERSNQGMSWAQGEVVADVVDAMRATSKAQRTSSGRMKV